MTGKEYAKIVEAYQKIYEQQIGVPLKEPTDRAAREKLEKMIPKGEKVHTFKSSLQKANYELDGQQLDEINTSITTQNDRVPNFEKPKVKQVPGLKVNKPSSPIEEKVETDLFDYLLEYLVAEGYADTNKAALAIMANMSEEWKQNIVEMSPAMQNLMSKPSNRLDGKRSPAPVVGQPPTSGAAGKLLRKPDTTIR
jgi:hypothetical protein